MRFLKVSIIILTAIILVGACFFVLKSCNSPALQKQTRFLMDTYCTIQAYGPKSKADKAITAALDRMEEIDEKFNFLNPTSPLYNFNFKDAPISDSEIIELIEIAQNISEQSEGTFDITIQPLLELWGFYEESPDLPTEKEIDICLKKTGYKNLVLADGQLKSRKSGFHLDLGGIAKGYAINEALKVLKETGIDSAIIDAGGDIYAAGKIKGGHWKIGIRNPRGEGDIGVVQVSNLAVVTSGDYERFFIKDGIKYCHILDPRTGYPARELMSVTVISSDPILADAWATALFVLGPDGMKFVEETSDMEAMMVTADQKIICSSGLMKSMDFAKKDVEE